MAESGGSQRRRGLVRGALIALGIAAGLPLALTALAGGAYLLAQRSSGALISSGERRAYLLYVPPSYDPAVPAPLVITLHGFMQWPAHQARLTRWNDLADAHGFIAVYPAGTGFPRRWRAGGGERSDVLFLADLIDRLQAEYAIDPARIYVNGLSNGGGMSLALACALSGRIAAFGSVAGAYQLPWEECRPARPVPAAIFHGSADPIVPYAGGPSRHPGMPFPALPEWVETLAARNGCDGQARTARLSEHVTAADFDGCEAGVVFYTIEGGGHTWPGGEPLPGWLTGPTTQEIDATRVLWEFFVEHPLDGG